jgi:transcriptional regulator with XRE-family HTH domain
MTGKEVRTLRLKLGLTQAELAEKVGVARNTVTRWEMGVLGVRESAARLMQLLANAETRNTKKGR